MHAIVNDPLPAVIRLVKLDDGTTAIFDHYICNGTLVSLIDINDHHRFIVNAERMVD